VLRMFSFGRRTCVRLSGQRLTGSRGLSFEKTATLAAPTQSLQLVCITHSRKPLGLHSSASGAWIWAEGRVGALAGERESTFGRQLEGQRIELASRSFIVLHSPS